MEEYKIIIIAQSVACSKIRVHPPVQVGVAVSHTPSHPRQQYYCHDNQKYDRNSHDEVSPHYQGRVVYSNMPALVVPAVCVCVGV